MIPYNKFALIYDNMEADSHSLSMAEYTFKIMRRFSIEAHDALDLCCGTGSAIKIFADRGINMAGLDRSCQMLAVAREKLRPYKARLYCRELPHFEIKAPATGNRKRLQRFDLVTSFYDSLNYLLSEKELKGAFQSVYRHLQPGGWFIFDMNTPHAMKTIWGDQTWCGTKKDIAWIFRNEYFHDKNMANCHITCFVKSGKTWERFDEVHPERGYPDRVLRSLLREVGFRIRGYYRCFSFAPPTSRTDRICAVVQRPL